MYNLVIQNNVSKEIFLYELEDIGSKDSIYYKFNIQLSNPCKGEYNYILFYNKDNSPVSVGNKSFLDENVGETATRILVIFDSILTDNTSILVDKLADSIPILSSGLLRIGTIEDTRTEYNLENKFKQYGN